MQYDSLTSITYKIRIDRTYREKMYKEVVTFRRCDNY